MSKRKKTAAVIDSDSDESDSGSNLDEVRIIFALNRKKKDQPRNFHFSEIVKILVEIKISLRTSSILG